MPRTRPLVLEAPAVLILLSLTAFYAAHPLFSVDFFWHLKLGEVIRARGEIPTTDLFSSVHPDRPYVQFNWLWDVLASVVHEAGGVRAIRVMQALVISASVALCYFAARLCIGPPAFALLLTALAVVLFEDRFRARPDALTLGFAVAMMPLLLSSYRRAAPRKYVYVFVLGLLWSNLHGGTSLLLVLSMGALAAGTLAQQLLLKQRDAPSAQAFILLLAAVLGICLSPTLLPGLWHWLQTVRPQIQSGNQEWQPSYTMLKYGSSAALLLVGLGPSAVALMYLAEQVTSLRKRGIAGIDIAEWLLAAGYLVLAHHAVRNSFLCIFPAAFMLRRIAQSAAKSNGGGIVLPRGVGLAGIAGAALLVAVSFQDAVVEGYGGLKRAVRFFPLDLAPDVYPTHAADFMDQAGIEGGILNDGRWGGYLIHRLWPACGIFIDTRHNIEGPMWRVFELSHNPATRPLGLQEGFRRYDLELAVFRGPTFPLIRPEPSWVLLFKAGDQEVYQHVDGVHARANLGRAQLWLKQRGGHHGPLDREYAAAVARIGASAWLKEPLQVQRLNRAADRLRDKTPTVRAKGLRMRARVSFDAGDYQAALEDYQMASNLNPKDPRAPLLAAISAFALGRDNLARESFLSLGGRPLGRLTPEDRHRAALLEAQFRP